MDIYSTHVPLSRKRDIMLRSQIVARLEVSKMRRVIQKRFPPASKETNAIPRYRKLEVAIMNVCCSCAHTNDYCPTGGGVAAVISIGINLSVSSSGCTPAAGAYPLSTMTGWTTHQVVSAPWTRRPIWRKRKMLTRMSC